MTETKTIETTETCYWCDLPLYDGREESGYTGEGHDWASVITIDGRDIGGDFGCDEHPITGEDGCGPHETDADVKRIITEYHTGPRVCPWTSDYGQCGLQLGHEGDHLPVPGNQCTFNNMGVACRLLSGHEGEHEPEDGVGFYDAHYVRSGDISEVQELVHFLTSFGDDNLPVKVRGRHNDSLRSVRWAEIKGDDNGVATHVEIVGY